MWTENSQKMYFRLTQSPNFVILGAISGVKLENYGKSENGREGVMGGGGWMVG
jgi:hypothetical protein